MNKIKLNNNLKITIETITEKTAKDIKWGLWAGVGAFFYGSNREPTDIDIMVRNSDMQRLANCLDEFMVMQPKVVEKDMFIVSLAKFKINDYEVETCSDMTITLEGKKYTFKCDELLIRKMRKIDIGDINVPVTSPEDIIVVKAICQRGKEKGKYDVEDVSNILKNQEVDWNYLRKRTQLTQSYDRVFGLLNRLGYHDQRKQGS